MKILSKNFLPLTVLSLLVNCSAPDASLLTHPPRKGAFPLYATIPGNHADTGSIIRIPAPAELDGISTAEVLLSGLSYPTGLTVDGSGAVYFTTNPPEGTGSLFRFFPGVTEPEEILTDLSRPTAVGLDSADQQYLVESGSGTLSRIDDKILTPIAENLVAPISLSFNTNDVMFIAEPGNGRALRITGDGTVSELLDDLIRPVDVSPGLVGNTFVLENGASLANGKARMITSDGSDETYLTGLINPTAMTWENGTVLLVAEGAPTFRVLKYSSVTGIKISLANVSGEIATLATTPLK